ncbi:MAG: DUF349 domain-containing protein [Gammaproteobacteria bacterium]|nr:DUF349 domain-containing protein [Gammaproteobacteria bacterium]
MTKQHDLKLFGKRGQVFLLIFISYFLYCVHLWHKNWYATRLQIFAPDKTYCEKDVMILKQFFKPKWQHSDARVRREAIAALDTSQDAVILQEIIQGDPEPSVRCLAVRKLTDLPVLREIGQSTNHWEVRQLANQRFQKLLAGGNIEDCPCPPLETRLRLLDEVTDLPMLEYLVLRGKEPQLRMAALNKTSHEGLCSSVAIEDTAPENRLAAIEKIQGKAALERVVKASRSQDKQVHQIAKERLDALIEEEERPMRLRAQREGICKRLELLLKADNWENFQGEQERVEQQWQEVEGEAEAALTVRFNEARQQCLNASAAYQQAREALEALRAEKQAVCESIEALSANLLERESLTEAESRDIDDNLAVLQTRQQGLASLEEAEEESLQTRFAQSMNAIRARQKTLTADQPVINALAEICRRSEHRVKAKKRVQRQEVKEFQKRWAAVERGDTSESLFAELTNRFEQAMQALQARYEKQLKQRDENIQTVETLLAELGAVLEQGKLRKALPLEKRIHKLLAETFGIPRARHSEMEARLQAEAKKIRELRSWQHWGNDREREKLCTEIEALIGSTGNPEEIARQVREAQTAWKRLSVNDDSKVLWERFNTACHTAYEPCHAFFATQAQERQTNLDLKKAICERIETFVAETDWESAVNWKAAHHFAQDIHTEWRSAGPTNRKHKRPLNKRFNAAMAALNAPLQKEREHCLSLRRDLIEQAQALSEIEELHTAIDEAKKLQAEWRVSVPGTHRAERELWKTFRSACDAVFNRRNQDREAKEQELQDNLEQRTALCEELETLAGANMEALATAPGKLRTTREQWKTFGPAPKKAVNAIEKRFDGACEALKAQISVWKLAEQRALLDKLQEKARLCAEVERIDRAQDQAQIKALLESAQNTWAALPPLEASMEKTIARRFQQACDAALSGLAQHDQTARAAQETLCIRMELLAGVESPPEAAQARMAYQVERLSRAMGGEKTTETGDKSREARDIERDWYFTGSADDSQEQRFHKAREAFYNQ